jgi:hypothetical protein
MSWMNMFSVRTRCTMPASMCFHSDAVIMRGMISNGITRSVPASLPYTANVIPTRRKIRSASARLRATVSGGLALQPAAELAVVFTYLGARSVRQAVSGHFIEEFCHIEVPC